MLHIGKSYIAQADGTSRLCADITIKDRRTTLWFGVDSDQEVCSFRDFARALFLQELFSVYLLSPGYDASHFSFNLRDPEYCELFLVPYASTESLTFHLLGGALEAVR